MTIDNDTQSRTAAPPARGPDLLSGRASMRRLEATESEIVAAAGSKPGSMTDGRRLQTGPQRQ